ncbi:MAG: UDP-N-acetylmuramate dehydrogenase [Ignavibacteria bacterium]|nr:UDP-N-acetylmuramate dehydrogenase [Ignavibacteria bacterium]
MINILKSEVRLSDITTIKLGGTAKYFAQFNNIFELKELLLFAKNEKLPVQITGGGSNIIFPDEGYKGIVLKNHIKEFSYEVFGEDVILKVGAGNNWDEVVKFCVNEGFQGIECLSGIPGSTGATPIQNVGAYGQEVSDVILGIEAYRIEDNSLVTFNNHECGFGYRTSIFKREQKNKYIVTEVIFKLNLNREPNVRYKDLADEIQKDNNYNNFSNTDKLKFVREKILEIRRRKSMVVDSKDANTVSCGSFFLNPVLNEEEYKIFEENLFHFPLKPKIFKTENGYKIPAAWLIENSGFHKGYNKNGAAISDKHSLALVNRGCTTAQLLELANEIESKVKQFFGIQLYKEPVIINY